MNYPIKERVHFDSESVAWTFAESIGRLKTWAVTDFGRDDADKAEPFYVDVINDPFATKDELMRKAGLMA